MTWPMKQIRGSVRRPAAIAITLAVVAASDCLAAQVHGKGDEALVGADPQITRLLKEADGAARTGNFNLALIQLRNAALLAPKDGNIRAKLGAMLVETGQPDAGERELRAALNIHADPVVAVPPLLSAMLERKETTQLLKEFPEPPPDAQDKTAPDILIARAMAFQLLAKPQEARAAMDRSLSLRRDASGLVNAARLAQQQQSDLSRANALGEEALKLEPQNQQGLLIAVLLARQAGNTSHALANADRFVQRAPYNLIARALRIEALLQLKRDTDAKAELDALKKRSPKSSYAGYYDGVLKARAKDFRGAWSELQNLPPEFVQADPGRAMAVARIATAAGEAETAGTILAALVAKRPDLMEARIQLAAVRLSQNSAARALEVLAPTKSSSDPAVQGLLAQAYLQLRRYDDAIHALTLAVATPNSTDLLKQQLALSQLETGDADAAIQALEELAERNPANAQIAGALISSLIRAGKLNEAVAFAGRLEKSAPQSPIPAFYRGVVLAARGSLKDADVSLGQAFMRDPGFLPALYYRADVALALGDPDSAKKYLQQVIARDPKNTFSYVKLAQIALGNGQQQDGTALLGRAIRAAPDDPTPRLALANYQYHRGDYQDAQVTVTELLHIARDNPEALSLQGQLQFRQGARAEAVATFRRLAAANDATPSAYVLLARAEYADREPEAAEDTAKHAVQLAPASPQVRTALIEIQIGAGREEDALATARSFTADHPGVAADILLAGTLERLKRVSEAEAVLEKSLATRPDSRVAVELSRLAATSGDREKATAILAGWLGKNPGDFAARRDYAALLFQTGDRAGARREYQTLLKQRPDDPTVLNNLGWLLQADDPDRALSLVSLAAKIEPGSASIADMLGWLKYERKDAQGAIASLERAHALDAGNAPISYHLALALDANGRRAEAKSLLQETLVRSPKFDGSDHAKQILARW